MRDVDLPRDEGPDMYANQTQQDENLDPRRSARGARSRDFASGSKSVAIPSLPQLLARVLVRLGLVR